MCDSLFSSPEHQLFRESVRKFVEEELRPRAREFDEMGRIDKSLYRTMGELGMLGVRYDPAYGGAGLDWSFSALMHEELGRCDNAGVATGIGVQTDMATPSLHRFGSLLRGRPGPRVQHDRRDRPWLPPADDAVPG